MNDLEIIADQVNTNLPARIEPVHGFDPFIHIIPIEWELGSRANPHLAEAVENIMEDLVARYGPIPVNYSRHSSRPRYTAFLSKEGGRRAVLGPAEVYTWEHKNTPKSGEGDRRTSHNVRIPILTTNPELDRLNSLQATIFEHPEQQGVFVYQVVGYRPLSKNEYREAEKRGEYHFGPVRILFDGGFYDTHTGKMVKAKSLPAYQHSSVPTSQRSLPKG